MAAKGETHANHKPAAHEGAHPVAEKAKAAVAEKAGAYPAVWRAGEDAPIVAPLITAGTYNIQQYTFIQFPLASVLLTTTGVSVVNTDPTYTAWVAVPNTTGPIQSVARPAGS